MNKDIQHYNKQQNKTEKKICDRLMKEINRGLPQAESKMWHGHPVWFLDDNPIVGYRKLKDCIRLMFWSGQSFTAKGLTATGSFKASEVRYSDARDIDSAALKKWLSESRETQWDYKNIVKRKGRLVRLR